MVIFLLFLFLQMKLSIGLYMVLVIINSQPIWGKLFYLQFLIKIKLCIRYYFSCGFTSVAQIVQSHVSCIYHDIKIMLGRFIIRQKSQGRFYKSASSGIFIKCNPVIKRMWYAINKTTIIIFYLNKKKCDSITNY